MISSLGGYVHSFFNLLQTILLGFLLEKKSVSDSFNGILKFYIELFYKTFQSNIILADLASIDGGLLFWVAEVQFIALTGAGASFPFLRSNDLNVNFTLLPLFCDKQGTTKLAHIFDVQTLSF